MYVDQQPGPETGVERMGRNTWELFFLSLTSTIDYHSDGLWKHLEVVCDFAEFISLLSNMKILFCFVLFFLGLTCH